MIFERELAIQRVRGRKSQPAGDVVALEEPLEIRLSYLDAGKRVQKSISITMRTPGHDEELAAGFLLTEGILKSRDQILGLHPCGPDTGPHQGKNVIRIELADKVALDLKRLERHFYTTSSCGVCGKTSLEALAVSGAPTIAHDLPQFPMETIHSLPKKLRAAQPVFDRTGGLHAAALFDASGKLLALREDIGRHNAVDKLIGMQFLAGHLPLSRSLIFVSGRASFELMQKTLMAGIPILAAVGAPSSLAVELAKQYDLTLLGFVRDGRFNVYHGEWRLLGADNEGTV